MKSYFKYITKRIVRLTHTVVLILRYSGAGNSQWGQDFTKLYLFAIGKRVRKESALTRYKRRFTTFPCGGTIQHLREKGWPNAAFRSARQNL